MASNIRPCQVEEPHGDGIFPQHIPMPCKEENWGKIGGKVNKLRMRTGVKKIKPKKTHKCKE
jgi:hypothetical protein